MAHPLPLPPLPRGFVVGGGAKDNRNLRIAVVFFCYELIFTTACDIINLISELIYFQHLFFIGRDYKTGRENLDRLLDIREPMKILILM